MKAKSIIVLCLLALSSVLAFSQGEAVKTQYIEQSNDEIECEGVVYNQVFYLVSIESRNNGSMRPDTTLSKSLIKNGKCPADSATVADLIMTSALNEQQELAYHMAFALQANDYTQRFNASDELYTGFTGVNLFTGISNKYFQDYRGIYRVFNTDNTSFFAKVIQVPNGRLRLQVINSVVDPTPTGTTYVLNPRSNVTFKLVGLGGVNYEFSLFTQEGDRKLYFPRAKVGAPTSVRIIKIKNEE